VPLLPDEAGDRQDHVLARLGFGAARGEALEIDPRGRDRDPLRRRSFEQQRLAGSLRRREKEVGVA
jgi:hypothetical protein